MTALLVTWFFSAILLYITAVIVPGFTIKDFPRALIAAIIIGFFNSTIRWFLLFLTLPINIITLGLFTFVINACILRLSAALLKGFDIKGWTPAILGALVMTLLKLALFFVF